MKKKQFLGVYSLLSKRLGLYLLDLRIKFIFSSFLYGITLLIYFTLCVKIKILLMKVLITGSNGLLGQKLYIN